MVQMEVKLIDSMGSDLSVVNAARVSFAKQKEVMDESDEKLIRYLATHNHFTPFTHATITLFIKAPIFVARQLGKHQVGLSWNEVSRRYVDDEPTFFSPDHWRGRPTNGAKQGSSEEVISTILFEGIVETWETPTDQIYWDAVDGCLRVYQSMIKSGVSPEQARMVLPQSMYTQWYWTGSLMAFSRVCNLRLDPHAQKETQQVAQLISDIIQPLFPVSWKELINV